MPFAAPRPCTHAGCGVLVRDGSGRCPAHARADASASDARRGTATERGYGYKWQQAREVFLRGHPVCHRHDLQGEVVAATVVDHVIPHKIKVARDSGDPVALAKAEKLFWDRKNWQALCKQCHDAKTATEDGGFGRSQGVGGFGLWGL